MPDELPVHVSRRELHDIEVPGTFEADGSFDVELVNHGNSLHMHLHLDDVLSEVAELTATNHYVEGERMRVVHVDVDESRLAGEPIRGKLKIVSAYGASTRWVDVVLSEAEEDEETVEVGESLAEPTPRTAPEESNLVVSNPEVPILVLGALAVTVAVVIALTVDDVVVLGGAGGVVVAVLVGMFLLLRG